MARLCKAISALPDQSSNRVGPLWCCIRNYESQSQSSSDVFSLDRSTALRWNSSYKIVFYVGQLPDGCERDANIRRTIKLGTKNRIAVVPTFAAKPKLLVLSKSLVWIVSEAFLTLSGFTSFGSFSGFFFFSG